MGSILTATRAAFLGDGGASERLARALELFHGAGRAILTDSGTTALTLALKWCLANTGRVKIALPAFCCYDLVTALHGAAAEVAFYDLDPQTLGPDWVSLARALEERPAAVVVAHLYGLPVDMPRVLEMTEGTGVTVIEDAAQGSGATLHRRPLGSFGPLAVLSFGRGKGVTGGRGGALLVNSGWRGGSDESSLLPGVRGVMEVPALKAQWLLARPWLYRIPASLPFLGLGDTVYRLPQPLHRISAVSAAVAERSWKERETEISRRQRNAEVLLAESKPGAIAPIPGAQAGWLRLPVVAGTDADPDESLGVMRSYPVPLPALPELNRTTRPASDFPGALLLARRLRTLPTHGFVSASVRARLGATLRAAFSA